LIKKPCGPAFLVLSFLLCAFFHCVRVQWATRARFNLVLHGQAAAQMRTVTKADVDESGIQPGLSVARLVYSGGRCVGYVDRYGLFIPLWLQSQSYAKQADYELRSQLISDLLPFALELVTGTAGAVAAVLVMKGIRERVGPGNQGCAGSH
jgi:hypothetical protein